MCITLKCEKAGSEEPAFCPHLQCQSALYFRLANLANRHEMNVSPNNYDFVTESYYSPKPTTISSRRKNNFYKFP